MAVLDTTIVDLGGGWRAEIHHTWQLPPALLVAWDAHARAYGDRGLFLCTGWLQTWWSVFGTGGRLFLVVLHAGKELRGIFPCWLTPDGRLAGMANELYYDFLIVSPHRDETLRRFLDVVDRSGCTRADLPYFSRLEGTGDALLEAFRQRRQPFWSCEQAYGPKVNVSTATWEEIEGAFHAKLRNNLKKGRRRAVSEGTLSFEEVCDSKSLDAVLEEAFAVEGSGWKAAAGSAIILNPTKIAWYKGISRWAAQHGALRVYLLRLNGRLVAFDLALESGRTLFALKTGFDQHVAARFSPGNLMRCEVLKSLWARHDLDTYDFLGETFPWKREWTSDTDVCRDLFVYPRTTGGWMRYVRQHGWKQPLKRATRMLAAIRVPRGRPR